MSKLSTFKYLVLATIAIIVLTGMSFFYSPANFELGCVLSVLSASLTSVWHAAFSDQYE